jgi:mannose-6-phosphate isomerase-like protein (cupin superfamily)
MDNYTIVNLAQVEDSAPKFGYGEIHEAHFATKPLNAEQTGLAYYLIKPGQVQPFAHKHAEQEELYVVLSGNAVVHLDDDEVDLKPMDAVRVAGSVTRRFEAGPDGAEILAFGAPAVTSGENDAEMVQLDGDGDD